MNAHSRKRYQRELRVKLLRSPGRGSHPHADDVTSTHIIQEKWGENHKPQMCEAGTVRRGGQEPDGLAQSHAKPGPRRTRAHRRGHAMNSTPSLCSHDVAKTSLFWFYQTSEPSGRFHSGELQTWQITSNL